MIIKDNKELKVNQQTSKVIESLHEEVESLQTNLDSLKSLNDDYKKKFYLVSKQNHIYSSQLHNFKNEIDIINTLLKRKERKIVELEQKFNNFVLNNEELQEKFKIFNSKYESLQNANCIALNDLERLKTAYNTLADSQNGLKSYYQKELCLLTKQFLNFKNEISTKFENLLNETHNKHSSTLALIETLTQKNKALESLYISKNKTILSHLFDLSSFAKLHDKESIDDFNKIIDDFDLLIEKHPELKSLFKIKSIEFTLNDLLVKVNKKNIFNHDELFVDNNNFLQ